MTYSYSHGIYFQTSNIKHIMFSMCYLLTSALNNESFQDTLY